MKLMLADQFDALITADKNLQYQQNFEKYPIPVIVLSAYRVTYGVLQTIGSEAKRGFGGRFTEWTYNY